MRHPIYTGLLIALLGTALATNLFGLLIAVIVGGYFYYAATVEERNLSGTLPGYSAYRDHTKMIIPFVL